MRLVVVDGVCYGKGWGCWVDNGFGMAFEFGFGFKRKVVTVKVVFFLD